MGWISVKDRLPKKLEKVLFHWLLNGHGKNISMGYMCDAGWNIYLPYQSYGLRADICPVTHWRHLLDSPKFKPPVREVGEVIIDDPLARLQDESGADLLVNGDPIYIMPPSVNIPSIAESAEAMNKRTKEFAEKFCEQNKDLLKRLADR